MHSVDRTSGGLRCLASAALAALVLSLCGSPPAQGRDPVRASGARCHAHATTAHVARLVRALRCLHNVERRAHGLRPLRRSRSLAKAARRHACDMARRDYFGHVTAGGRTVLDRVRVIGYGRRGRVSAGENIYYGLRPLPSPARVMAAWMASPGHRQQVLNPAWRELGIGSIMRAPVRGRGGVTAVAVFGSRARAGR
jgi:uncharacterized protein YkwD